MQWKKRDITGLLRKNPNQIAVRQPCQEMQFKNTDSRLLSPRASVNLSAQPLHSLPFHSLIFSSTHSPPAKIIRFSPLRAHGCCIPLHQGLPRPPPAISPSLCSRGLGGNSWLHLVEMFPSSKMICAHPGPGHEPYFLSFLAQLSWGGGQSRTFPALVQTGSRP